MHLHRETFGIFLVIISLSTELHFAPLTEPIEIKCSICLSQIEASQLVYSFCGQQKHSVHQDCAQKLDLYSRGRTPCPSCRQSLLATPVATPLCRFYTPLLLLSTMPVGVLLTLFTDLLITDNLLRQKSVHTVWIF